MEVGLQIFESEEFGEIRTRGDWENPEFCLADVCRVLDLRINNVVVTLKRRDCDSLVLGKHPVQTAGGVQLMYFVNEPGLYQLIFTSRKPNAVKFQDWIFRVVIPSIRKAGFYTMSQIVTQILNSAEESKLSPDLK